MQEAGDHMIDAKNLTASELNTKIRESDADVIEIHNILGQRYIANASNGKKIKLFGTCGNNLGSFLDGSEIEVFGNVQDACANTMNDGKIILHGMCGDALGYGMRGKGLWKPMWDSYESDENQTAADDHRWCRTGFFR